MLCHPGATCMEDTIQQHFTWRKISKDIGEACKKYHTYQTTKITNKKYGHIPVGI